MASAQQMGFDEIKLAMAQTNELFNTEVIAKRNFGVLDDVYTTNARILPPGAPMVSGRESIKKFWSELVEGANAKAAVLTSVDVMPAGDGMVEIGRATLTVAPQGEPTNLEVKYVVYWREENGRWKWHVDIWNPNV